jgi:enoyl-CoA hydratase/carnithine racemase
MKATQPAYFTAYRSLRLSRDAEGVLVVEVHTKGGPLTFTAQDHAEFVDAFYRIARDLENKIVILTGTGGEFIPGIDFSSFYEWGVVAEVVRDGKALARARELASVYLKAPEVTRRNTRAHFMQPLKERIAREIGYGLSLEGTSAADLVKSMQAKAVPLAEKGKVA